MNYKLKTHLSVICHESKEYEDLWATWSINKRSCRNAFDCIKKNYSHYTEHGTSHAEAVITNIELLLGEEQIKRLSPTDTWLLLHGAYLHDIGMALIWERVENEWCAEAFGDYIKQLQTSLDEDLRKAANYILQIEHSLAEQQAEKSWLLQASRYITLIIADYYRSKHGTLSKEYIQGMGKEWEMDLTYNGLIQTRLISLLGEIAHLHTCTSKEIMQLPYKAIGHNADYIHPRFIAEMIRMGDLLDVDNNRFNPFLHKAIGGIPKSSQIHIDKHLSTKHILITPEQIEYEADCPTLEVYRETRAFVTALIEETDFLTKEWRSLVPENFLGSAPRLEKSAVLLRGEPDLNGVADLRFNITQERAFQMIEGANLYSDKYLCIRELLQNAIDACRIQLWRDLKSGLYDAWLSESYQEQSEKGDKAYQKLTPFDLDEKIYQNYSVQISSETVQESGVDFIKFTVSDNGTGITVDTLKQMCNVGMDYGEKQNYGAELKEMPVWLKPTGGFGIGLQSVFLLVDWFEIVSRSEQGEITAQVESRKKNGYVRITASSTRKKRGTDIILRIPRMQNKEVDYYNYDPFGENHELQEEKIFNLLWINCVESLFPVEIIINKKSTAKLSVKDFGWKNPGWKRDENYFYMLGEDLASIKVWDLNRQIYFEARVKKDDWWNDPTLKSGLYFKGMQIDYGWGWDSAYSDENYWKYSDFACLLDIYGMHVKEVLALNRTLLSRDVYKQLKQIRAEIMEFYTKQVGIAYETQMSALEKNGLPALVLFKLLNLQEREIYLQKCSQLDRQLLLYEIDWEQQLIFLKAMDIRSLFDLIETSKRVACIGWDFTYERLDYSGYLLIKLQDAVKNGQISRDCRFVILSTIEHDFLQFCGVESVSVIDNSILYYLCKEEGKSCYLNEADKESFYSYMLAPLQHWKFADQHRRLVPALERYKNLVIEKVPDNTAFTVFAFPHVYCIISPFMSKDITVATGVDRDSYVTAITEREDFKKMLAYVYENRKVKECSKEELEANYKKLILEGYDRLKDTEHPIKKL